MPELVNDLPAQAEALEVALQVGPGGAIPDFVVQVARDLLENVVRASGCAWGALAQT